MTLALMAIASMAIAGLSTWATPAGATAGGSGSPIQLTQGRASRGAAQTQGGGPDPIELDLGLVAAAGGSALAVAVVLECRPGAARRRALRRFRAQLRGADVATICGLPPNTPDPGGRPSGTRY